jgi:hypothetical protein
VEIVIRQARVDTEADLPIPTGRQAIRDTGRIAKKAVRAKLPMRIDQPRVTIGSMGMDLGSLGMALQWPTETLGSDVFDRLLLHEKIASFCMQLSALDDKSPCSYLVLSAKYCIA